VIFKKGRKIIFFFFDFGVLVKAGWVEMEISMEWGKVDFQACLEIDFDFMVTGGGGGWEEKEILREGVWKG